MEWPDQYDFASFGPVVQCTEYSYKHAGAIILDAHALNRPFKPTLLVNS